MRHNLAPYISQKENRSKLSLRAMSAIACMLVVIVTLSVVLPITLLNESNPSEPMTPQTPESTPPENHYYSTTEKDFKGVELGYYINPLYVGEEDANASNFGVCLEEYCIENDLDILRIPRNTISEFYSDDHIAWRNTYMNIHKENPSIRYWKENILSPATPGDPDRNGQMSITLTVMTKEISIPIYELDKEGASSAMINGVQIYYIFTGRAISDTQIGFDDVEIAFNYGDYKYFVLIEPEEPFLLINNGEPLTPPDISVVQIYIEDILSTAK